MLLAGDDCANDIALADMNNNAKRKSFITNVVSEVIQLLNSEGYECGYPANEIQYKAFAPLRFHPRHRIRGLSSARELALA
jgi:hypothetical protein